MLVAKTASSHESQSLRPLETLITTQPSLIQSLHPGQTHGLYASLGPLLSSTDFLLVFLTLSILSVIPDARNLFSGDKASKILRLTGTAACQDEETASLAIKVLNKMDIETKKTWLDTREGLNIVKRVLDKAVSEERPKILRFLAEILRVKKFPLPDSLFEKFEDAVRKNDVQLVDEFCDIYEQIPPASPDFFINVYLETLTQPLPYPRSRVNLRLLKCLKNNISVFNAALRSALSTTQFEKPVQHFLNSTIPDPVCDPSLQECPRHYAYQIRELYELLCQLPLLADNQQEPLDSSMKLALIEKMSSLPDRDCYLTKKKISDRYELRTLESQTSIDWQKNLYNTLVKQAEGTYTCIIDNLTMVCRDLESRTHCIEEPLRNLKKQSEEILRVSEERNLALTESRRETENARAEVECLAIQKGQLEKSIEEYSKQLESLNNRFRDMETELHAQFMIKMNEMKLLLERNETLESNNERVGRDLSVALNNHSILEDRVGQMKLEHETRVKDLQEQAQNSLEREVNAVRSEISIQQQAFQAEINTRDEATEAHKRRIHELAEHIQKHDLEVDRLDKENQQRVSELQKSTEDRLCEIQTRHDELIEKLKQEHHEYLESMKTSFDHQINELKTGYETDHIKLSNQLKEAQESHNTEKSALDTNYARLKVAYETKCKEYDQVKNIGQHLMAVMGGGNGPLPPQASTPHKEDIQLEQEDTRYSMATQEGDTEILGQLGSMEMS
ncbi:hypothetical protein NEOLI_001868 [Neolecta irregularis DAH-3]|uniref:Uncharacterized protein n=1 Tax=Neolecta irregularis (strain DAH-3) TaxID=1198029 RepID=A0A1U7LSJ0_NEOID|nr:hypothetical protein NEOLI_001868 [Neolecta irregularis DAH-3]|eukprot:OLL25614.1 hypothetical protein NEOLI_001868 [Neolecta irregularis DAH-3]